MADPNDDALSDSTVRYLVIIGLGSIGAIPGIGTSAEQGGSDLRDLGMSCDISLAADFW